MARSKSRKQAVLRTAAECASLAHSGIPQSEFGITAITLDLPIDKVTQARFQSELSRLLDTCGCVESSIMMLAALASSLVGIWYFGLGGSFAINRWLLTAGAVCISLLIALVVKISIVSNARRRFRQSMLRLASLDAPATGV